MLANLLAAGFDIALNHKALYQPFDISGMTAAVKDFLCNPDLLLILLVGVGMVGIHDAGRVLQITLGIQVKEQF